jgi:hypothetical protein
LRLAAEVLGPGQARHERLRAAREPVDGGEREHGHERRRYEQDEDAGAAARVAGGDAVPHVHPFRDHPPDGLGRRVQDVQQGDHRGRRRRREAAVTEIRVEVDVDAEEREAAEIRSDDQQPEGRRPQRLPRRE